ncbi:nucleotide disphospho-sugar-binding domain-containing protein [Nocardiopsis sp. B62]|uniref:nucleotide disphospho-sugar-binding domain-containing protein n=1 Tax=Nocardiopsis sp. B62 TaxID=2824874 RepID=UPI001B394BF2|nr:nucleotide disphospho-sugar-binding domain-containing protein [Nocardiopsis sp. B62]MBQ1080614.1 DUF1205 domain-containing protein [Nocardiopsis sp. B62]
MRVLLITCASKTHLYSLVPLAWALRSAGHEVRVATGTDPNSLLPEDVTATGLTSATMGEPINLGSIAESAEGESSGRAMDADPWPHSQGRSSQADYPGQTPDEELGMLAWVLRGFSPESMLDELVDHCRSWRPDLVLWDYMMMYAGPLAARSCGAAHARVLYGVDAPAQLVSASASLRGGEGLDPLRSSLREHMEGRGHAYADDTVFGHWSVSTMPPWTWHPSDRDYVSVRPIPFNGPSTVPDWLRGPAERRRVCLTLGLTAQEVHSGGASLAEVFDAVSDIDAEIVATVREDDLAQVGSVPDNVRVAGFVPLSVLLPTCSAIIHHGGSGTVNSALEHSVPQLFVPSSFANQRWWAPVSHATGWTEQGAGAYVSDSRHLDAAELRASLSRVLDDPSYADNAERLRRESARTPSPADVVPTLEKLTARFADGPVDLEV